MDNRILRMGCMSVKCRAPRPEPPVAGCLLVRPRRAVPSDQCDALALGRPELWGQRPRWRRLIQVDLEVGLRVVAARDECGRDETGRLERAEPAAEGVGGDVERLGELAVVHAVRLGARHTERLEDQEEREGLRSERAEALRPFGEDPHNVPVAHERRAGRGETAGLARWARWAGRRGFVEERAMSRQKSPAS